MTTKPTRHHSPDISAESRSAVYRVIFLRRDVHGLFLSKAVPDATLSCSIMAAHIAPPVGFIQPWKSIMVRASTEMPFELGG